jgi:hypothetical protein
MNSDDCLVYQNLRKAVLDQFTKEEVRKRELTDELIKDWEAFHAYALLPPQDRWPQQLNYLLFRVNTWMLHLKNATVCLDKLYAIYKKGEEEFAVNFLAATGNPISGSVAESEE